MVNGLMEGSDFRSVGEGLKVTNSVDKPPSVTEGIKKLRTLKLRIAGLQAQHDNLLMEVVRQIADAALKT